MTYRHTQTGTLTLLCSALVGVVGAALTWRAGQWAPAIAVIVLATVIAFAQALKAQRGRDY